MQSELLAHNWAIFPCHSFVHGRCTCGKKDCDRPAKHPRISTGRTGASKDPKVIADWWKKWPNSNVAIATGKESGLIVLDVDLGGEESLIGFELPETVEVITGSGGRHLYYKRPETDLKYKTSVAILQSVDVRADGGYVIAPPSNHASGGAYFWEAAHHPDDIAIAPCPDWLLERITERPFSAPATHERSHNRFYRSGGSLPKDIHEILSYIPSDDYKIWIDVGMAIYRTDPEAFDVFDEWSKKSPKYSLPGVRRTWTYFTEKLTDVSRPIGIGTIKKLATDHGWTDPEEIEREEIAQTLISGTKAKLSKSLERARTAKIITPPETIMPESGLIRRITDYILATSVYPQPILAVAAATTFVGCLLGGKVASPTDLRTNLYSVALAPSGSGKDHAHKIIRKIAEECGLDRHLGGDNIASGGAVFAALSYEKRLCYLLDEFGLFLRAIMDEKNHHKAEIMKNFMTAYSRSNSSWLGTDYANRKENPRTTISNPHLCLYGISTHQTFFDALSSSNGGDGSIARMIFFDIGEKAPRPQKQPGLMIPLPSELAEEIKTFASIGGDSGQNLNPDPVIMPFDPEVDEQIDKLDLFLQSQSAPTDAMRAIYNREVENTIKLSLIHAASQYDTSVGLKAFAWASGIVRWSTQMIISQLDRHVADNTQEQHVKKILRLIGAEPEGITRSDLTRKTQILNRRERDSILTDLIESGQIVADMQKKEEGAGRPTLVYRGI
jgi:hypothetical protein